MKKSGKALRFLIIAFIWLLIWQLISVAVNSPLLVPSPIQTFSRLFALMQQAYFWHSAGFSLLRVLLGYVAAVVMGIALGVFTYVLPFLEALLSPIKSIIKATPVVSFILLVQLWVSSFILSGFMAFLMVLPLVWTNVYEGIRATDKNLLEMAEIFRFGRYKTFRMVYMPSTLPHLLSACATGLGFAWKAGVAAEVLARTANSIGKQLIESKSYYETADMFAWTAVVVILSISLEQVVLRILARIRKGRGWMAQND